MAFSLGINKEQQDALLDGYLLLDYLELVDWTARAVLPGKRGAMVDSAPPILARLGISNESWLKYMAPRTIGRMSAVGNDQVLRRYADSTGRKWVHGCRAG